PAARQGRPLKKDAGRRWARAGENVSVLRNIDIRIADLGGTTVGRAAGHTFWLDDNASGWGWFVDPTSWDDSKFTMPGDQGEQKRLDLLTVLEPETGHVRGYDHADSGVIVDTLTPGR